MIDYLKHAGEYPVYWAGGLFLILISLIATIILGGGDKGKTILAFARAGFIFYVVSIVLCIIKIASLC